MCVRPCVLLAPSTGQTGSHTLFFQEVNLNQMKGDVTSCPSEAAPHVTMETGQSNGVCLSDR